MKPLAPALFSVPKPPPRTPVPTEAAEVFVATEAPASIVSAVTPPSATPDPMTTGGGTASKATMQASIEPEPKAGTARLSVDIPQSTLRALKIRAIERGCTVREYVLTLLERDGLTR